MADTSTDPVERAGRIIAAHAQPYTEWDELTEKWQEKSRECARAVLDDLAATQPSEHPSDGPMPEGITEVDPW